MIYYQKLVFLRLMVETVINVPIARILFQQPKIEICLLIVVSSLTRFVLIKNVKVYYYECYILLNTIKCVKSTTKFPWGNTINKGCIVPAVCRDTNFNFLGFGWETNCCATDGCNSSTSLTAKFFPIFISISSIYLILRLKFLF